MSSMESILNGLIRLNISFIQDVDIIPNKWKNPNYDYYYIQYKIVGGKS